METQNPKPQAPKPAAARIKKEEKISNVRGIRNAFAVIIALSLIHISEPTRRP